MKKFTFILMILLAYAGFTVAQTIEDFESIKMNAFDQGANGLVTVVPNPDSSVANPSSYVGKMVRGKDGQPWAGWYATMPAAVDMTANKYVHVKVWKPRISPTCFKFEKAGGDSGDTFPMTEITETGKWVEVVYDMSAKPLVTGEYVKIVLIPDFLTPVGLTEDITIYFDDMYVNNDPAVGSAPVQMMENFECIPLNLMVDDKINDLSSMMKVANPDKSGINITDWVIKFNRDKDGLIWSGFWSKVSDYSSAVDVTTNKYVHVKVWKPRVSTIKFKLEGGDAGTKEVASMSPQTTTNAWEDIVFDFSDKTGTYPIIAFLPDFSDPVGLTEDLTMYFDDIIVNNDPNPSTPPSQIFNIDMVGQILPTDSLFITGSFGGINGTWVEPGKNANNKLTDPDGDGIYSIALSVPNQVVEFKFVKNAGWGPTNPGEDPFGVNRQYTITGNCNILFTWGVAGSEDVTLALRDNKQAGKILMYPNPVRSELTINSTNNISNILITNTLGKVVGNFVYSNNKTINTNNLSRGMYFVTFVNADGTKVTQKLIKE